MFRIIHTADWHLGQNFYNRDRLPEQRAFLDFLLEQIKEYQVDLLVVAGDVFDTANPPRAAEEAYYNFLTRLYQLGGCEAVIVGGNHDSPIHLDAPKSLLSCLKIHTIGAMPDAIEDAILRFERNGHRITVAAVPFLRDRDVRLAVQGESFDEMEARTRAGISAVYEKVASNLRERKNKSDFVLATGHLTAVGGMLSDSERSIHIGNLGSIGAEKFDKVFDYVALGHLHQAQAIGATGHIRYSGSPIPLSFSESPDKELRLLEVDDDGSFSQQPIAIPVFRPLLRIEGSADSVQEKIAARKVEAAGLEPWIEVIISEGDVSPLINDQIRQQAAANGMEVLKVGVQRTGPSGIHPIATEDRMINEWAPIEVFTKRIEHYEGDVDKDRLTACFHHVVERVHQEAGS